MKSRRSGDVAKEERAPAGPTGVIVALPVDQRRSTQESSGEEHFSVFR